jgi:hypothetical protein
MNHIKDVILNKFPIEFKEDTHQYFVNGEEYTSVSKILETLTPKFDDITMSEKCSINKKHEHFGKTPDEILEIWKEKNKVACENGSKFHDNVQMFLEDKKDEIEYEYFFDSLFSQFMIFHNDIIVKNKLDIVGLELKVASPTFKVCGTFDALFKYNGNLFIFDWKTNSKFDTSSKYKLNRPYSKYDKSKLTYYTFQVFIYKWILENEYQINISDCRIVWFNENGYEIYKPKFEYEEQFIKRLLKNCTK